MNYIKKNWSSILLFAFVIGFVLYRKIPLWENEKDLEGQSLPHGSLRTLAGSEIDLSSRKEKVILVSFWATWCVPCRVEMPMLVSLRRELDGQSFEIFAVTDEDPVTVARFLEEHPVNFPIVLDRGPLQQAFRIQVFPTLLQFKDGKLVSVSNGVDWFLKFKIRHAVTGNYF